MNGVIYILVQFFRQLLELILDIICTALFICAIMAPWRVFMWPIELSGRIDDRWQYRGAALYCFFSSLFDVVTLPFALLMLFTWRVQAYTSGMSSIYSSKFRDKEYFLVGRLFVWEQFGRLLFDIAFIVMLVIIHVCVWRIPLFWSEMGTSMRDHGSAICAFCLPPKSKEYSGRPENTDQRVIILRHCLEALFEILFIPMILILLLTGYRMPNVVRIIQNPDDEPKYSQSLDKKVFIFREFILVFADLPFFLCALITCLLFVRVKYLFEDVFSTDSAKERRILALKHFALSFRDVLALVPFIVLVVFIYRGFLAIRQIMSKVSRWAPLDPMVRVRNARLARPADGRVTGLVLHIDGDKDMSAALPTGTPVNVYVRDTHFWKVVGRAFGSTAATVGDTMMPVSMGKYFDPTTVSIGSQTVQLVFDFDISKRTASIEKSLTKLNGASVDIQIEYGSHEGTLCSLRVGFANTVEGCTVQPVDLEGNTDGDRLGNVFWKIVLIQFALLLADIAAAICFIILHLIPPRAYRVYSRGFEPESRTKAREHRDALAAMINALDRAPTILRETTVEVDRSLRGDLNEQTRTSRFRFHSTDPTAVSAHVSSFEPYTSELVTELQPHVDRLEKLNQRESLDMCVQAGDTVRQLLKSYIGALCQTHSNISAAPVPKLRPTSQQIRNAVVEGGVRLVDMFSERAAESIGPLMREPTMDYINPGDAADIEATAKDHVQSGRGAIVERLRQAQAAYNQEPWCGGKEGWGGLRKRVFIEVRETLFDLVAVVCALIVLATLYRTYSLWWSISNRRHGEDVRTKCARHVLEIGIDFFYLLKALCVMVGIRGLFAMPRDIVVYMCAEPSFAVFRKIVDHHLNNFLADLIYMLTLVFAWDAVRLTLATAVFGAFAPGVLLEGAVAKWAENSETASTNYPNAAGGPAAQQANQRGQMRNDSSNVGRAGVILIYAMFWMYGLPILLGYQVGRNQGDVDTVPIVYFAVMLAVITLSIVLAFAYAEPRVVSLRRAVVRSARPTWVNGLAYLSVAVDGLLLLAAAFGAIGAGRDVLSEYDDGRAGLVVHDASRYVYLLFGEAWVVHGLPFGAYFAITVMLVHFVLAAMPVVTGHMLHWSRGERLTSSTAWVVSLQILGQYLLPVVTRNVAELLSCEWVAGTAGAAATTVNGTYAPGASNGTYAPVAGYEAVVASGGRTECYTGQHLHLSVLAMILFTYYLPSAAMRNSTMDESSCAALDVAYAQLYRLLTNAGMAFGVVMSALLWERPAGAVGSVLAAAVWCLAWTVAYPAVANREEGEVCTVRAVRVYRGAMYLAVAVSACVLLGAREEAVGSLWPLYAVGGVVAASWAGAAVACAMERRGWAMDGAEECREVLLEAASKLEGSRQLVPTWGVSAGRWRSTVGGAVRASTFAQAALVLERHVYVSKLPGLFFASRAKWLSDAKELVAPCDEEEYIDVDEYLYQDRWKRNVLLCCDCGCCSHLSDSDSDCDNEPRDEDEDIESAIRVCTVLRNLGRSLDAAGPATFDLGAFNSAPHPRTGGDQSRRIPPGTFSIHDVTEDNVVERLRSTKLSGQREAIIGALPHDAWKVVPSSRNLNQPRDRGQVFTAAGGQLTLICEQELVRLEFEPDKPCVPVTYWYVENVNQRSWAADDDGAAAFGAAPRHDTDYRTRLARFYAVYNPVKLDEVDDILQKYAGREDALFTVLVKKYGPEPEPTGTLDAPPAQNPDFMDV